MTKRGLCVYFSSSYYCNNIFQFRLLTTPTFNLQTCFEGLILMHLSVRYHANWKIWLLVPMVFILNLLTCFT